MKKDKYVFDHFELKQQMAQIKFNEINKPVYKAPELKKENIKITQLTISDNEHQFEYWKGDAFLLRCVITAGIITKIDYFYFDY